MINTKHLSICLFLIFILSSIGLVQNTYAKQASRSMDDITVNSFTEISPFSINSNSDFLTSGFFTGYGNESHPYIMDGYNITDSSWDLISISDTTSYFIIRNCILNGLNTASNGINLHNVAHGTMENNTISNMTGSGINLGGVSDYNMLSNNTIHDNGGNGIRLDQSSNNSLLLNTIFRIGDSGIGVWSGSNENDILNNTIFDNNVPGIQVWSNSDDNEISNNTIYDNDSGISVGFSSFNIFNNNIIYNNNFNGLGFGEGSSANVVTNNQLYAINGDGISMDGDANLVANNEIHDVMDHGIRMGPGNDSNISSNTIYNTGAAGIGLDGASSFTYVDANIVYSSQSGGGIGVDGSDQLITNNEIYDHDGPGIVVWAGDNTQISRNTIFNNTANGIDIGVDSTSTIVHANFIYGNGGGISISGIQTTVTSNQVHDNGGDGITTHGNNNRISNNTIYDNGALGVGVSQVVANEISHNTIYNNNHVGVNVWSSTLNNISYNLIYNNQGNCNCLPGGIIIDDNWGPISRSNTIQGNVIYDNNGDGVWIHGENHVLKENSIFSNSGSGFVLGNSNKGNSNNITVVNNDFMGSNQSTGFDEGTNNNFLNNFWSDWVTPDTNDDGIVDLPFMIEGPANNQDPQPLKWPNQPDRLHFLSPVEIRIINLDPSESAEGTIVIDWNLSKDTFNHTLTYSVFYTEGGNDSVWDWSGFNWIGIATNVNQTQVEFDTTKVDNGVLTIRVIVSDDKGFEVESIIFIPIENPDDHTTSDDPSTTTDESPEETDASLLPFLDFHTLMIGILVMGIITNLNKKKQ